MTSSIWIVLVAVLATGCETPEARQARFGRNMADGHAWARQGNHGYAISYFAAAMGAASNDSERSEVWRAICHGGREQKLPNNDEYCDHADQHAKLAEPRMQEVVGPTPLQDVAALGMRLSVVGYKVRERFALAPSVKGVVVTDVASGGPAAARGLQAGDVIIEVDRSRAIIPEQVLVTAREAATAGRDTILLTIDRKGERRTEAVRVKP